MSEGTCFPFGKVPASLSAAAEREAGTFRTPSYVELLGRSNFSFLQGASHPEEMALRAMTLGYKGLALCDVNGLYGVVRGYQAVYHPSSFSIADQLERERNKDFKFYVGAEMTLPDKSSVVLVPISKEGYHQLCRLITLAKREAPKNFSCVTLQDIVEHSEDLLAFPLPPWTHDKIRELRDAFYDRLAIPVWRDFTWESMQVYQQALELERQFGLPLFATQRPLMHHPERKPIHDVLTCILHKTTLTKAKTLLAANGERHLRPLPELAQIWKERPDLLERTFEIASRIRFSLEELRYEYPSAVTPPGVTPDQYLRHLTEEGLKRRYPEDVPPKVRELVEYELGVIRELDYEDYFLTLWDICEFARTQGILYQGRGSAANSAVCFALGLTSVDPERFQLMFERFISRERGEPPDIDVDFESQRREEVLQYVYRRYGADHAAMVSTVICYRGRMALRESGKVLGIPEPKIDALIKFMGREGFKHLVANPERAQELGLTPKQIRWLLDLASQIIGFPRHLGIHTGGFVIARRPIHECVPVEKATMENRFVVQWNKDDIDVLRMMKIDLLGLGMLSALKRSFDLLKRHKKIDMELATVPAEDPRTYAMIQKADTVGVFQIESRAQMSLLPRLKPKCFYDLVIEVAIVRPGPLQGGMVHPYLRRRDGLEKPYYAHPDLKNVLGKTLGVPIFQEQVMQIASTVCGFTGGEADELRRIMSSAWKRKEVMDGLRQRLLSGMLSHGLKRADAEQLYKTIQGFASYGFPESHAASFALLTYASCYLKCHHPDVFVCAVLNSQPMGFYSPRTLIADAQRHGVRFKPVDVQFSKYDYDLEGGFVRVGYRAIFGVHERHMEQIAAARSHGPFENLTDFIRRAHIPKAALVRLAAAGAFSSLGLNPRQALWKVQALCLDPQSLLFGKAREHLETEDLKTPLPKENPWETLNREYTAQGYSLLTHPLHLLRKGLEIRSRAQARAGGLPYTTAKDLEALKSGQKLRVAGLVSVRQRPPTAKGFAFLTLEDEFGFFNIVINPPVYMKYRDILNFHPLIEVTGVFEKHRGVLNIRAETLAPLPQPKLLDDMGSRLISPWPGY